MTSMQWIQVADIPQRNQLLEKSLARTDSPFEFFLDDFAIRSNELEQTLGSEVTLCMYWEIKIEFKNVAEMEAASNTAERNTESWK